MSIVYHSTCVITSIDVQQLRMKFQKKMNLEQNGGVNMDIPDVD